MSSWELLSIAIGLAMDAFAVAIATSIALGDVTGRQTFRLAWHFGLFQALMPIIGWYVGMTVEHHVRAWDHWVAFCLLAFVGGKAIRDALRDDGGTAVARSDPTRGFSLVLLSIATSVDALAVGLSFAALQVPIWTPSAVIGLVAGSMTLAGMRFGARLGRRFGRRMEIAGGLVLIAIGCKIVVSHTMGG